MDGRDIVAVLSLTCDLVGGFLLSLPLVWNVDAALAVLERVGRKAHRVAQWAWDTVVFSLLATAAALLVAGTSYIVDFGPAEVAIWVVVIIWVVLAAAYFTILFALASMELLLRFLSWVKRGRRDRVVIMGRIGFAIFLLGLTIQGWLNLTS